MADRITADPNPASTRPAGWDASLSVVLMLATALVAAVTSGAVTVVSAGVRALGLASIGSPRPVAIALLVTLLASVLGAGLLRRWWNARRHSRGWLTLAALLGCAVWQLAVVVLRPWPDLLSDEVALRGQVAFYLEGAKTFVPWLASVVTAFVTLRCEPGAHHTDRG